MWKEFIKGYEISDKGEVRNSVNGRMLKQGRNGRGYRRITIKNKHYSLHRLVAETFIPNPNSLPYVIFKDTDKENVTVNNLQWSIEQNVNALSNTIKDLRGNIKLTQGMVRAIQFNKKTPSKTLANMYNVSVSTIYSIKKGKNVKRFESPVK